MLDINTPLGLRTLEQELEAIEMFRRRFPDLSYVHTPKKEASIADGFLFRSLDNTAFALVEMKCRTMSIDDFRGRYKNEWLVTFDKIMGCKEAAKTLCVAFVGMLYLVPSKILLVKTLWTPTDAWGVHFRMAKTETQATVNGGKAKRDNAYLDMSGATEIGARGNA